VSVSLDTGDAISLTVRDDGGARGEAPAGDGYGLLGIRERVQALGGSFTLTPDENGMRAHVHLKPS
jgi:two-component system sensor histidine kinase UhpB